MNGAGSDEVRTTASGVQETYYGRPVIKLPHWRWLVILYFFFGAIAGGSYTIGTIANLFSRDPAVERTSRYLSLAAVLPCPILLVLDLGRPERALNMFRVLKLKSPMSLGSWALLGLGMTASASAALQVLSDVLGRDVLPGLRRAVGIVGLPFSVFISGYTGILLAATNVPLWARNYLFIGPTFIASAFSGSFAALSILLGFGSGEREGTARGLARAEVVCLSTELLALTTGLVHLGKLGKPLTTGRYGRLFWPGTYIGGIIVPLGLQLAGPVQGESGSRARRVATALLVLSGGFILRMLMIFAGRESASRPEDYFEYTRRTPSSAEIGNGPMSASAGGDVRLRIRPGMDVWDAFQEHYLGSVIHVRRGTPPTTAGAREVEKEGAVESHPLVHEEGQVAEHAGSQGNRQNGEAMGPFPTAAAGNHGPMNQSAGADYATGQTDDLTSVISFAVRPGRINLGVFTRPFYVPCTAVHSISMERVVVDVRGSIVPAEWQRRPAG